MTLPLGFLFCVAILGSVHAVLKDGVTEFYDVEGDKNVHMIVSGSVLIRDGIDLNPVLRSNVERHYNSLKNKHHINHHNKNKNKHHKRHGHAKKPLNESRHLSSHIDDPSKHTDSDSKFSAKTQSKAKALRHELHSYHSENDVTAVRGKARDEIPNNNNAKDNKKLGEAERKTIYPPPSNMWKINKELTVTQQTLEDKGVLGEKKAETKIDKIEPPPVDVGSIENQLEKEERTGGKYTVPSPAAAVPIEAKGKEETADAYQERKESEPSASVPYSKAVHNIHTHLGEHLHAKSHKSEGSIVNRFKSHEPHEDSFQDSQETVTSSPTIHEIKSKHHAESTPTEFPKPKIDLTAVVKHAPVKEKLPETETPPVADPTPLENALEAEDKNSEQAAVVPSAITPAATAPTQTAVVTHAYSLEQQQPETQAKTEEAPIEPAATTQEVTIQNSQASETSDAVKNSAEETSEVSKPAELPHQNEVSETQSEAAEKTPPNTQRKEANFTPEGKHTETVTGAQTEENVQQSDEASNEQTNAASQEIQPKETLHEEPAQETQSQEETTQKVDSSSKTAQSIEAAAKATEEHSQQHQQEESQQEQSSLTPDAPSSASPTEPSVEHAQQQQEATTASPINEALQPIANVEGYNDDTQKTENEHAVEEPRNNEQLVSAKKNADDQITITAETPQEAAQVQQQTDTQQSNTQLDSPEKSEQNLTPEVQSAENNQTLSVKSVAEKPDELPQTLSVKSVAEKPDELPQQDQQQDTYQQVEVKPFENQAKQDEKIDETTQDQYTTSLTPEVVTSQEEQKIITPDTPNAASTPDQNVASIDQQVGDQEQHAVTPEQQQQHTIAAPNQHVAAVQNQHVQAAEAQHAALQHQNQHVQDAVPVTPMQPEELQRHQQAIDFVRNETQKALLKAKEEQDSKEFGQKMFAEMDKQLNDSPPAAAAAEMQQNQATFRDEKGEVTNVGLPMNADEMPPNSKVTSYENSQAKDHMTAEVNKQAPSGVMDYAPVVANAPSKETSGEQTSNAGIIEHELSASEVSTPEEQMNTAEMPANPTNREMFQQGGPIGGSREAAFTNQHKVETPHAEEDSQGQTLSRTGLAKLEEETKTPVAVTDDAQATSDAAQATSDATQSYTTDAPGEQTIDLPDLIIPSSPQQQAEQDQKFSDFQQQDVPEQPAPSASLNAPSNATIYNRVYGESNLEDPSNPFYYLPAGVNPGAQMSSQILDLWKLRGIAPQRGVLRGKIGRKTRKQIQALQKAAATKATHWSGMQQVPNNVMSVLKPKRPTGPSIAYQQTVPASDLLKENSAKSLNGRATAKKPTGHTFTDSSVKGPVVKSSKLIRAKSVIKAPSSKTAPQFPVALVKSYSTSTSKSNAKVKAADGARASASTLNENRAGNGREASHAVTHASTGANARHHANPPQKSGYGYGSGSGSGYGQQSYAHGGGGGWAGQPPPPGMHIPGTYGLPPQNRPNFPNAGGQPPPAPSSGGGASSPSAPASSEGATQPAPAAPAPNAPAPPQYVPKKRPKASTATKLPKLNKSVKFQQQKQQTTAKLTQQMLKKLPIRQQAKLLAKPITAPVKIYRILKTATKQKGQLQRVAKAADKSKSKLLMSQQQPPVRQTFGARKGLTKQG